MVLLRGGYWPSRWGIPSPAVRSDTCQTTGQTRLAEAKEAVMTAWQLHVSPSPQDTPHSSTLTLPMAPGRPSPQHSSPPPPSSRSSPAKSTLHGEGRAGRGACQRAEKREAQAEVEQGRGNFDTTLEPLSPSLPHVYHTKKTAKKTYTENNEERHADREAAAPRAPAPPPTARLTDHPDIRLGLLLREVVGLHGLHGQAPSHGPAQRQSQQEAHGESHDAEADESQNGQPHGPAHDAESHDGEADAESHGQGLHGRAERVAHRQALRAEPGGQLPPGRPVVDEPHVRAHLRRRHRRLLAGRFDPPDRALHGLAERDAALRGAAAEGDVARQGGGGQQVRQGRGGERHGPAQEARQTGAPAAPAAEVRGPHQARLGHAVRRLRHGLGEDAAVRPVVDAADVGRAGVEHRGARGSHGGHRRARDERRADTVRGSGGPGLPVPGREGVHLVQDAAGARGVDKVPPRPVPGRGDVGGVRGDEAAQRRRTGPRLRRRERASASALAPASRSRPPSPTRSGGEIEGLMDDPLAPSAAPSASDAPSGRTVKANLILTLELPPDGRRDVARPARSGRAGCVRDGGRRLLHRPGRPGGERGPGRELQGTLPAVPDRRRGRGGAGGGRRGRDDGGAEEGAPGRRVGRVRGRRLRADRAAGRGGAAAN
ncbi:hypothetical protein THAOC_17918, partial [Thalassiosira oceanica]